MDVNAAGALSAYAYQTTLAQAGSASQALAKGMSAAQSQAADTSALLSSAGATDPALADAAGVGAMASLAYSAAATTGNGTAAVQSMLASMSSSSSVLFASSDKSPLSAAALNPGAAEALARYAYDQSADPKTSAQLAAAAAKQALQSTGLDLLA